LNIKVGKFLTSDQIRGVFNNALQKYDHRREVSKSDGPSTPKIENQKHWFKAPIVNQRSGPGERSTTLLERM
jgi:hypothetical protein